MNTINKQYHPEEQDEYTIGFDGMGNADDYGHIATEEAKKNKVIYINEDKLSLLAEGKDRKQQARAKTKKVIINYFNDSPMLYEPNEETNGMNLLDFLEQEVMHDFFHSRSRSDAKGYFICLEPMVANIILHAGWQQDRHDNGVIARLQAILNYIETLYTQGKIDPRSISLDSTIEQLNQEFGSVIDQLNSEEEARMNNASYTVNEDYEILDDVSYEQAHEIGNYSYSNQPLCYTQSVGTWKNSFDGEKNKVYALLKKGWNGVAEEHGESLLSQYPDANAYDEYGLSMIFLFVSPDDELVYSNTRWNHEADYGNGRSVDHAFTKEDISNLVGYNFNQRFVGYTEEELSSKGIKYLSFKKVPKLLAQGVRWEDIFAMVYDFREGFAKVELNDKYNYITEDNTLLSPNQWFDGCSEFKEGFSRVSLNNEYNFLTQDGNLLSPNQWFNGCGLFYEGFGLIRLYDKYNFIAKDGTLLWNKPIEEWFDYCGNFHEGFAMVKLNGKYNYLTQDGTLLWNKPIEEWFDGCWDFKEGFGQIELNDKYNFIAKDGTLLWNKPIEEWFYYCGNFHEGFGQITLNGKYNYLTQDGTLLWNKPIEEWFDGCWDFKEGFGLIRLNNKYNYLTQDGVLLWNKPIEEWFDDCDNFDEGFSQIELNGQFNFLTTNGTLLSPNQWFNYCGNFHEGFGQIALNVKYNYLTQDGTLLWNKPIEEWFDGCGDFSHGFGMVCLNSKYNFITQDGTLLWNKPIEEWFDECEDFNGGFSQIELNGKYNYLTQDGTLLWNKPIEEWFDGCGDFKEGFGVVLLNDEWYALSSNGQLCDEVTHQPIQSPSLSVSEGQTRSKKIYINENKIQLLKENIEYEVSPEEVETSSFKIQSELQPEIWKDKQLNPQLRLKLLDIADDFFNTLNINWVKPMDIILTGSICNFNWSQYSDIDLHIVIDFREVSEQTDFVQTFVDSKKNEWNEQHTNLEMFGFPVELYVQDVNAVNISSGVYSLEKDEWIQEPSANEMEDIQSVDSMKIKIGASSIMTLIDDIEEEFNTITDKQQLEILNAKVNHLSKKLKELRQNGLNKSGEMSIPNLIYKVLRRTEYLNKMWDLSEKIYDKINSIN